MRPEDAHAFMRAMEARYACKLYDPTFPVTMEEEHFILETARLTPTSFGLEPWIFVSVRDRAVRGRLFGACLSQEAVGTAPLIVAVLVRGERDYRPDGAFVRARAERFPGGYPVFRDDYEGYYNWLSAEGIVEHWARSQSYLACANMMTAAAALGVDSCAIEGFKEDEVLAIFEDAIEEFDAGSWRAGILVTFGRRGEPERERIREPLSDLVIRV